MFSDPFLVILLLVLLVVVVQVWSVQRVERRSKLHELWLKQHDANIGVLMAEKGNSYLAFASVAEALHEVDNFMLEKGLSERLLLTKYLVYKSDSKPQTTTSTDAGVLPPAT